MVKTYDETNGEWQDVPASYDQDTGTVTAQVSHFCLFALFSRAVTPAPYAAPTGMPTPAPGHSAPPSPTAVSVFSGIILWVVETVMGNMVIMAGLAILVVAVIFFGWKRRRDRIMYLF